MSEVNSNSPKSSPRGSRSPAFLRGDTTGTLKSTISLGRNPHAYHSGSFYLIRDLSEQSDLTGNTNLIQYHGLEHSFNKYCGKKTKEDLSAFLPDLPGNIDIPGSSDNSSLMSLIEKPPIGGKELHQLGGSQLMGFRLHPGPLPEQYRYMFTQPPKKKKHKKSRTEGKLPSPREATMVPASAVLDIDVEMQKEKAKEDPKKKERKKKKKKKEKDKDDRQLLGM